MAFRHRVSAFPAKQNAETGICPWPLGALTPQFPRVFSQNVRASWGTPRNSELCLGHPSFSPWHTPSRMPRPTASHLSLGGTPGRKKNTGKADREGQCTGAGGSRAPVKHPRANLSYICERRVAARLRSAGAVCRGVAGVANPSVLSSLAGLQTQSCRAATRRPLEQAAACSLC